MDAKRAQYAWSAPGSGQGFELARRRVAHGYVRRQSSLQTLSAKDTWAASHPIWLPRGFAEGLSNHRLEIRRTTSLFERTRVAGVDFQAEVWKRLGSSRRWRPAGAAVDLSDEREIEKVFVDGTGAPDLWAKLSWISRNESDVSLRIRCSFGSEVHGDWHSDPARAQAADQLCESMFPEGRLLARNAPLLRKIRSLTGRKVRLSERIVFSNAPGGGAAFHHDAETKQLGVLYGQFAGRTAWFALPKAELAALVETMARGKLRAEVSPAQKAMRALERHDLPALDRLLNSSARFTRSLVEHGALYVLAPGDVLILPSHSTDEVAWHSVFALGSKASLAHSYGIFGAD